jgi:hypothetical protein
MIVATGCGQESEKTDMTVLQPTIEAARQDPAATVGLFYDLLIQKEYSATESLVTSEFVTASTDNGQRSYAEVQRRRADTAGYVLRYEILDVRYPDRATAHVDIDVYRGSIAASEQTVFLTNGSQGWQISGGLSRNIVP